MKFKELTTLLYPFQAFQIGDVETGQPLTYMLYNGDRRYKTEYNEYNDYEVCAIVPKINKFGCVYLGILLKMEI